MQARQPLQVSDWITTVSNSVRMMAPGGADLEAGRVDAVLADVAHHQPAPVGPVLAELLDELDVPPVDPVQPAGVVVAVAAHLVLPAAGRGELVPLLAGHLACLAADADGGVGVEAHRFDGMRAGPLDGHAAASAAEPAPPPSCPAAPLHHAFSTLHTKALPSWMRHVGIADHATVRVFTTSPVTTPSQPQCQGMPTWWTTLSPSRNGRIRRVTSALARICARGVLIRTQSVFLMPFLAGQLG